MAAVILPSVLSAKSDKRGVPQEQLVDLISEYKGEDGFDLINLGYLATTAVRKLVSLNADEDSKEIARIVGRIRRLVVADFEDCSDKVRRELKSGVDELLSSADLLMEIRDDEDVMQMYGVLDEKSENIRNFVLYAPEDCALICLFGSIPLDAISDLMSE